MSAPVRQGPLTDVRVLEFQGLGPVPFCGMLLSDLGAEVVRVDRKTGGFDPAGIHTRGRRSVALDLKNPASIEVCLALVDRADIVLEGFRPGVMERLGLGPEVALERKPSLVYGRMTGWGQSGPLATQPGHDINYIALTGALHAIGTPEQPTIPINLIGDLGGGALYLAFGVMAALHHSRRTGAGQVVDCAMTDGTISTLAQVYEGVATGLWHDRRQDNIVDGGAHFYNAYRCSDGLWLAVGAIEPQFYRILITQLGIENDPDFAVQMDRSRWPALKGKLARIFAGQTRDEWCRLFENTEGCVAPVLSLAEAPQHPHDRARGSFVRVNDLVQPAPAPRFSRTPGAIQGPAVPPGAHTDEVLVDWGVSAEAIAALRAAG